jgi:hypothetical protein
MSGYRMYSTSAVKDKLTIEFDNTEYAQALPQMISISDEKTGREELNISVKQLHEAKQFVNEKKISIDVRKLSRGLKIVSLVYLKSDTKEAQENIQKGNFSQFDRKTERIILVD